MNINQIIGISRVALAAAVPIIAFLVTYGVPKDIAAIVTVVVLLIGIGAWSLFDHSDKNTAIAASKIPGVEVTVNPQSAANPVLTAALDPTNSVKVTTP